MSTNASPQRFYVDMDSFYDPEFTADISNKMRVPQRISVIGQGREDAVEDLDPPKLPESDASLYMHVPDRILITGAGQNGGAEETSPEPRLEKDSSPPDPQESLHLSTPPRCLTLDNFPSLDDDIWGGPQRAVKLRHKTTLSNIPNGDLHSGPGLSTSPVASHSEDDVVAMRKQLRVLSRRLMLLERDNQQRQQREVVLYSVGVLYFLLKGIMWLQKHW